MNCKKAQDILMKFQDGMTRAEDEKHLARHLDGCEDCKYMYSLFRSIPEVASYDGLAAEVDLPEGFAVPADFTLSVMNAVRALPQGSPVSVMAINYALLGLACVTIALLFALTDGALVDYATGFAGQMQHFFRDSGNFMSAYRYLFLAFFCVLAVTQLAVYRYDKVNADVR